MLQHIQNNNLTQLDNNSKKQLAKHPNTHPKILTTLAFDADLTTATNATNNPNCPQETLTQIIKQKTPTRESAIANPNCPKETLKTLSQNPHEHATVAKNPNCPKETLQKIFTHTQTQNKLTKSENTHIKVTLAQNPNTPTQTLTQLATDPYWAIRNMVAQNPNTPPETLNKLANDDYWNTRASVAANPNTPIETLIELTKGKDPKTSLEAYKNPNTALETLQETVKNLQNNPENKETLQELQTALASRKDCPQETLTKLAKEGNQTTKQAVAQNPNTDPQTLQAIQETNKNLYEIADNPNTNTQTLQNILTQYITNDRGELHAKTLKNLLEKNPTLTTLKEAANYTQNPNNSTTYQTTIAIKILETLQNLNHLTGQEQTNLQNYLKEKYNIDITPKQLKTKPMTKPIKETTPTLRF